MKKKTGVIILIVIFLSLFIVASIFLNQYEEEEITEQEENIKQVEILEVTKENFEEEVINSEKTVLVDFYADWCAPCKRLEPTIQKIANENENVKVVRVNVDQEEELAIEYEAISIPTLVVIKEGSETARGVGVMRKSEIVNLLEQ